MRPQLTIKTSHPLQKHVLQSNHSEENMADLRAHRDQLIDKTVDNIRFLDIMQNFSGLSFRDEKINIWVYQGRDKSISSPLLLAHRGNVDVEFLELVCLLSKDLLYQNIGQLQQHEMLDPGYDQIDVTANLLAYKTLETLWDQKTVENILDHTTFGGDQLKTWRTVREKAQSWDPEQTTLLDLLGIQRKPEDA